MKDLIGQKFGRLLVVSYGGRLPMWKHKWICRCDCGRTKAVVGSNLTRGTTRSCGCFQRERASATHTKYLLPDGSKVNRDSLEYRVWKSMRARCLGKDAAVCKNYAGRGITICKRWNSFMNFLSDMGKCPPGMSIERMDNDKGYSPKNCKWATRIEQQNNKRTNVFVSACGRRLTIAQWAREIGITTQAMHKRYKAGWSSDRIVSPPTLNKNV